MTKILFVDDEKRWVTPYMDELRSLGFDVHYEATVDGAMGFLSNNGDQISLLILDIMMPHGKILRPEATQDGLRTGVHFYEQVRERMPDLPVIILTNVSDEDVRKTFERQAHCLFIRKPECLPYELLEKVVSVLKR